MKQKSRSISLYYSRIPSIPLLNLVIYQMQSMFLKLGINTVFASRMETKYQKSFLKALSSPSYLVFCKSYKFPWSVKKIKTTLVYDVKVKDINAISKEDIINVMWTLVFCDYVSQNAKRGIRKVLPANFPVYNK